MKPAVHRSGGNVPSRHSRKDPIRICYMAGREYAYVRTRTMVQALRRAGFRVDTCLPPNKKFRHYPALLTKFLVKKAECDLVIVGFYGALLMPFVWMLTRKPIIFDIHSATYKTMIDWERARPESLKARLFFWVDRVTMLMADRIIMDSNHHIERWAEDYRVPRAMFERIFLSTDDTVVYPKNEKSEDQPFLVHFHGEFAQFHGVDTIIRAAAELDSRGVEFQIIGKGTTYKRDRALADSLNLTNIRFIDWVEYEALAEAMCRADVCLGFFGDRMRSYEVFTNKVVEALAVRRPLITMRNIPVSELLKEGESVIFVKPGDPEDLARAIMALKNDGKRRKKIAENGYQACLKHCTIGAFADRLSDLVYAIFQEKTYKSGKCKR